MSRFTGNTPGVVVLCVVNFVVVLDVTIVATALPAIRSDLGFSDRGLTWVVTAYTVVLGALLVPGGRVTDRLGPRRTLVTGLAVFVAASVTCAVAWTPAALVAARAVQGSGAALLAPAALALLTALRDASGGSDAAAFGGRAVGWFTAAGALGGGSGWVIGGLATELLGWPAVFWVNVPIGAAVVAATPLVLPAVPARRGRRVDVRGAVLITVALGLLVHFSWTTAVAAAALIALFVAHIRRDADPLLPPRLLRPPAAAGANLTAALLTAATTPAMYLSMLHLQQVRGTAAAVLFPVFNLGVVAGSLPAPRWRPRFSAVGGFLVIALGGLALAWRPSQPVVAFALVGAGLGAASVASTRAGTEAAAPETRGVAGGVLTASAQIGTALGLAALTPLGHRGGTLGAVGVALIGAVAALLLPSRASVPSRARPAALLPPRASRASSR